MIEIYGKDNCTFCDKAKKVCEDFKLEFTYINIDDNIEQLEKFVEMFPSAKTVPQIMWNKRHIGGFSELAAEIENTGLGNYGQGDF